MKTSSREYILRCMGRYRSRIHTWDVINEAHDWADELNYGQQQLQELTKLASETARLADPTAFRIVNNCLLWGEYVARRQFNAGTLNRPSRTAFEYLKALRDARIDYDAVGLQVYCPARDMLEIERHLERFFVFGKPIHITELGVPSAQDVPPRKHTYPIQAVWHGTAWNEETQADWVEQFYTICYSKPQIQAITWWDFSDPGYMPYGGFITRDLRPKESYRRLLKLLGEWRA